MPGEYIILCEENAASDFGRYGKVLPILMVTLFHTAGILVTG